MSAEKLIARKSGINGRGCFAAVPFSVGKKIAELVGEKISNREAALRDIVAGEELTLDYTPSQHPGRPCTCGAARCRGVMS